MDRGEGFWAALVAELAAIQAVPCAYIEHDTDTPEFTCPVCMEVIPPHKIVQQECPCRLKVCDNCLFSWAEAQLPRFPTCFTCKKILDIAGIGGGEVAYLLLTQAGISLPSIMNDVQSAEVVEIRPAEPPRRVPSIMFPRLATENELEMEERRWVNIQRMRPADKWIAEFDRNRTSSLDITFNNDMERINTFFVPRDPQEGFLLIIADTRIPNTAISFKYFFFVTPTTTLAEIAALWKESGYPIWAPLAWGASSFHPPVSPAGWTFHGRPMVWSDTITSLRMVEGDAFEIDLPENPVMELEIGSD